MTYSIDVSMVKIPSNHELEVCVIDACKEIGVPIPEFELVESGDLKISGRGGEVCWISVMYLEPAAREVPDHEYIGGVEACRDWWFAGGDAYALGKSFGGPSSMIRELTLEPPEFTRQKISRDS